MQTQAVTDAPSTDATAMRLARQAKVMDWPLQRQVSQRSALVSGVVNLGVACGQIGVGIFSHSQALVADGFHSLADVIGDLVVLSTARASHHPPDSEHSYGHRRFENAATMLLSALLIGAAGGITWRSLSLLQFGYGINPVGRGALLAACAVLAIKEGLFRYLLRVARRSGSSLLEASAWHARADALSSIVVAIGILGNLLGVTILDPIAAVVVAALLLRLGLRFGRRAFDALTDRALSADETAAIRATLATTQGVVSIHQLRTRQLGDDVIGDAHVQVAARVSVSEGHQIAEAARLRVVDQHGLSDFLVHIDAEDDGDHRIALEAPARNVVLDALRGVMPAGVDLLDASPLHYLDGQVDVDCLLRVTPAAAEDAVATLDGRLRQLEAGLPWLRSARVFVLLENRT